MKNMFLSCDQEKFRTIIFNKNIAYEFKKKSILNMNTVLLIFKNIFRKQFQFNYLNKAVLKYV